MARAARSVLAFGGYMVIEGVVLLVAPNLLLRVAGLPETNEVWIRAAGWALVALGYYYIQAARHDLRPFFGWTVQIRTAQFGVFILLVALGMARPMLLVFSGIEFLAGMWTRAALRAQG